MNTFQLIQASMCAVFAASCWLVVSQSRRYARQAQDAATRAEDASEQLTGKE